MTMPKPKTPRTPSVKEKKPRKPRKIDVFDQDYAWKDYISKDFFDCLAIIHPKLYADVDISVPPEFLEQEISNALRGKYKIKGKEKKTDKLVKMRLLTGEDYYIYVHLEVQDQLKDDFPERLFIYRSLISLRYATQNITTIVLFTGKSPSVKHTIFQHECYDSVVLYHFNYFVIADQNVEELARKNSAFALAVLAAKYTIDTEGDEKRRVEFKLKITELANKNNFPLDKLKNLLSFVLDYMLLSTEMENEFLASSAIISSFNTDTMVKYRGRGMFEKFMDAAFEPKLKAASEQAAREAAREAAKKAQEERENTIHALLKINFSPEKIAETLGYDLDFVKKVANSAATS
jgi:hypothetical protein